MALSPNYNWSEPDNSSLVKDGAQAMRTLGDAIDTSVWNVGFGQAGKSKIINGDFRVNQRAFTSTTASNVYIYDRFQTRATDGTSTFTANTFTAGSGPVTSIPALNYLTIQTTGQTITGARTAILQKIEDVRTLSNQTVTLSFYAKASAGTPSVAANFTQIFGTGGSSAVDTAGQKAAITTSWARYSFTFTIPSVTGKTIGSDSGLWAFIWTSAGSDFNTQSASLGIQTATIDIWGVQVEYGSKATPFQTASGGSIQGELAMCQRYYFRNTAGTNYGPMIIGGYFFSTIQYVSNVMFPVTMRVAPTSFEFSNLVIQDSSNVLLAVTAMSIDTSITNVNGCSLNSTVVGGTQGRFGRVLGNNNAAALLAFGAEL
jgi:hypothetical protein